MLGTEVAFSGGWTNTLEERTVRNVVTEEPCVHMNGRIYDPRLGRMLQADPFVQNPKNSQSLNRYSYVLNNPLSYTDPSGYFSLKSFWKKIRPFVAIALSIYMPQFTALWQTIGVAGNAVAIGFVTGGVAGFVASGNINGALIGAFSGAAFGALGNEFSGHFGSSLTGAQTAAKTVAHGAIGGVMSFLGGGKFGHGFAAAGVTQAFAGPIDNLKTPQGRIVAAATVGGTASTITGGKFANGAVTAAFSRAFNEELHQIKDHKLHLIASKNAPAGHVTIAGETPDGLIEARGFYPNEDASLAEILAGDVEGEVIDDIALYEAAIAGENGIAIQSMSVTQAQHDAALRFMNGFAKQNQYNLYKCSCVTAALSALNAAGVAAFNTDVLAATPLAVYQAIDLGLQIPRPQP